MKEKKQLFTIILSVTVFCIVMAVVDGVIKADYFVKSLIKLVLFTVFPLVYSVFYKDIRLKSLFTFDKSSLRQSLVMAIGVYVVIVGGYFLLKDLFDFSNITVSLTQNIGVTKNNFLYVSLYISFVNSLLEEFFFRGFCFLSMQNITSKKFSYIFSAGMFAIYHIAMMTGWFSYVLYGIILAGLFAGGLIFNYLNDRSKSIFPSYFVHMAANFAINTVGFLLFG